MSQKNRVSPFLWKKHFGKNHREVGQIEQPPSFSGTLFWKHTNVLLLLSYYIMPLVYFLQNSQIDQNSYSKEKLWMVASLLPLIKACFRYFLSNFYFFCKNCEKCFLFHLKSLFRSWDIQIFVIFPLPFHTFQIQKNKWKWSNFWCHELACISISFGITQ